MKRFALDGGIGGDEAKHGGMKRRGGGSMPGGAHGRLNHACPFANATDTDFLAVQKEFDGDLFWAGVAGHDCFGGVRGMLRGRAELDSGFDNAGAHFVHWQVETNSTGRTNQG